MRLSKIIVFLLALLGSVGSLFAQATDSEPIRLLPQRVGDFKQVSPSTRLAGWTDHYGPAVAVATEEALFVGKKGTTVRLGMVRFRQDVHAYELLSGLAASYREQNPGLELREGFGTAGFALSDQIQFFKGPHFVRVMGVKSADAKTLEAFATELSQTLDKGEGDIPVLIKHLPNADEARKNAIYWNSFSDPNSLRLQQPVLSAIQSGGNADAVLATYGPSKVLIIEFNTPQLAADNDRQIIARIQELWKLGQPAPTAYQRVGNYSVFVFDAPDEQTAKRLINEIKYEQVVQWLGDNPNIYKEAEKRYINTTLGVLVAVLKASGYALIACLGLGGLIGGLLFTYRRAQQKAVTFSDAGGMLRLNLDDLTAAQTDPGRLLRERN